MPYLNGLFTGLVLMLAVGPSFFFLIRLGMNRGFLTGLSFAFGIFLSDVVLITLIVYGFSALFSQLWFKEVFSYVTAVVVLAAGLYTLLKPQKDYSLQLGETKSRYYYIFQGFGLNIINPFTIGVWLVVLANAQAEFGYHGFRRLLFVAGMLTMVLFMDSMKAFLAKQLSRVLTTKVMKMVNRSIGFLLLGASVYFFWEGIRYSLQHWG